MRATLGLRVLRGDAEDLVTFGLSLTEWHILPPVRIVDPGAGRFGADGSQRGWSRRMSPIEPERTARMSGERKVLYVTAGMYDGNWDGGTAGKRRTGRR